jgi:cytosolic carboxypeptidase protein 2/3
MTGKTGWHVDPEVTYSVKFHPSNQNDNFDPELIKREKNYHTMSFIYKTLHKNESVFFAYDEPYTYSQNLKNMVHGIRNDPNFSQILKVSNLCQSLGENNVKLLTITDKVDLTLNYYEML